MTPLASLTTDELADGICLRAGRIAAAQAELLLWIAEFDRREGWAGPGMLSCAHWLSWRIGMSLGTARDQVRVGRRLEELPAVAAAFADGRVPYSKVRAITRVAEPDDGIDWVELARHSSAAQLDKLVRGVSRAREHEQAERDPDAAAWRLRTRTRYDERGGFVLTISGPAHLLPVIRAGLDAKKAQLQRERDAVPPDQADITPPPEAPTAPEDAPDVSAPPGAAATGARPDDEGQLDEKAPGWPKGTTRRQVQAAMDGFPALQSSLRAEALEEPASAETPTTRPRPLRSVPPPGAGAPTTEPAAVSDADALLALTQEALEAERSSRPDAARRRRAQLGAHIDPLSGWARQADGELLPPPSLRAVVKALPGRGGVLRLRPVTAFDRRRFDLGRSHREVSHALRELLGTIDGERCRFPGCTRHRKLHAHHVVYWRDGGPTDFGNLVLVCSRHHTLIHAQGFQLVLHADRRLEIHTADGVPLLHHPAPPWGNPATLASGCGQLVSAETLAPEHAHERLDLRYAVSVVMAQAS